MSPCLSLSHPFGASLRELIPAAGFRTFASRPQNGFVGVGNCFISVSPDVKNGGAGVKKNDYASMTSHA
jgi:hypothetical protein